MQKKILKILLEISEKIHNTESIDNLFFSITYIINEYVKAKEFAIMIEEKNELIIKACSNSDFYNKRIPVSETVVGEVYISAKETILTKNLNLSQNDTDELSIFCGIPIKIGDKIYGVICFVKNIDDFFDDDELAVIRHIASQFALAIERHLLSDQKRITDNIKMVGILKSSVAHDIANLLNVVEVYLELLEDEVDKTPQVNEYFEDIYRELKRVSYLATDMLDYSKQNLGIHREKFNVSEIIEDLKHHNKFLLKDMDIKIKYILKEDFEIYADKDRLFRVNFNLVNNAIDALRGGGDITFKIKKCGNYCIFLVADNGIGIDKENINKLFSPFFTFGKVKGTGLGLAVVDEIIKAHFGKIYVKSKLGKYTCFMIRIPINGKAIN